MRMNLTKQTPKHLAKQKMTPGFFGKLLSMVGLLSLLRKPARSRSGGNNALRADRTP